MKFLKLTAVFAAIALSFSACKKDNNVVVRSNENIVMNGGQMAPPNQSAATGMMKVSYNSKTRLLDYSVTWTGLTGNATAVHVHGPADPGFAAPVIQNLSVPSGSTQGTFSGSLLVDGFLVKQDELLAGKYYIDIHSAGTFSTPGEIRGQVTFK